MDSNYRSLARKSRFLSRKANCGTERGSQKGCFDCELDFRGRDPIDAPGLRLYGPEVFPIGQCDSPSRCCRWFRFGDPCLLRMTAHWILL
jgi:hypothetical protein